MALGFTRGKVIGLFTLEGFFNGVLAALVAAVYGIPLLAWIARTGWAMPGDVDSYGFAIGDKLFPTYSAGLVAGTTLLVLLVTAFVSFLPTRRIASSSLRRPERTAHTSAFSSRDSSATAPGASCPSSRSSSVPC